MTSIDSYEWRARLCRNHRPRDPRQRVAAERRKASCRSAFPTPTASAAKSRRRSRPSLEGPGEGGPDGQPALGRQRLDHLQQQGQAGPSVRTVLQRHARFRVRCAFSRRQPGAVLRPGRARHRYAAPEPHLREGRLRPLAADHLRRQRHLRAKECADRRPAHRPRHRRLRRRSISSLTSYLPTWFRHDARQQRMAAWTDVSGQHDATLPCAPKRMPIHRPPRTSTRWVAPS
jgi:hypothetical protein